MNDHPHAGRTTVTEEEIRSYGVRMDGVTACRIVYGVGRTRAYEMLRTGDHDLPVLKAGRKYVVPTSAVLRLLEVEQPHGDADQT